MEENNQVEVNNFNQTNTTGFSEMTHTVHEATVQQMTSQVIETKPYTFRKLKASDIPYATNLLKKIGLNKFSKLFQNETIVNLLKGNSENIDMIAGGAIFLEIAQIILEGAGDCEELYKLLSVTSNLSVEQVKDLDLDVFFNMIVDFVKKEEFVGFFKAVSKYLA